MDTTSEPALGSLMASAPTCSPVSSWIEDGTILRTDSLLTLSASDKPRSSFDPDLRQELLLLLRVGVAHHLVDTQVRMGTVAEGDATRHSGHFLHHNDVIEVAQTDSTVFH